MKKHIMIVLVVCLTGLLFFEAALPCLGSPVLFSGSFESALQYCVLQSFAPANEFSFSHLFNLKMDLNPDEKTSGAVVLQYSSDPAWEGEMINQAYLDCELTPVALLRIGRQKIQWGSGFAWNPTNYLGTDKNRADWTTHYPGVDVINFETALTVGDNSLILILKPREQWSDWGKACKISWQAFRCDLAISACEKEGGSRALGFDFATSLGNFTVYSETALKTGTQFYITDSLNQANRSGSRYYIHGVFGINGSIWSDTSLTAEFYYNQEGWDDREDDNFKRFVENYPEQAPGMALKKAALFGDLRQEYIYSYVRKEGIFQNVILSIGALWNINDQSCQLTPTFNYSLSENMMFECMGIFYTGESTSEFGSQPVKRIFNAKVIMNF